MAFAEYTAGEVAQHNTPDDCWVVVDGRVCDVTAFLNMHPGGVGALSKAGRGGQDVSSHFARIGHSAQAHKKMKSMQIGTLVTITSDDSDNVLAAATNATEHDGQVLASLGGVFNGSEERAIRWHGARRAAITAEHPERIAQLEGNNEWTVPIGLAVSGLHFYVAMEAQHWLWWQVLVAAWVIGAWCKMAQFAFCHDICHNTAGWLCNAHPLMKEMWLHTLTLPAIGGETHHYYGYQHIGHHAALGESPLDAGLGGISPVPNSDAMLHALFDDSLDGDLPSPTATLLLLGNAQGKRGEDVPNDWPDEEAAGGHAVRGSKDGMAAVHQAPNGNGASTATADTAVVSSTVIGGVETSVFNTKRFVRSWTVKLFGTPIWHFMHYVMLLVAIVLPTMVLIPPVLLLLVAFLLMPPQTVQKCAKQAFNVCCSPFGTSQSWIEMNLKQVKALLTNHSERKMVWALVNVYAHTWVWMATTVMMLTTWHDSWHASTSPANGGGSFDDSADAAAVAASATGMIANASIAVGSDAGLQLHAADWSWQSVAKGISYLLLSELFLHGFCFHPYFGYFLGVHRSFGGGFAPPSSTTKGATEEAAELNEGLLASESGARDTIVGDGECQPTMSTYSFLTSVSCFNLNYHVEHHDFPKVPWSRLPQITALAPSYYNQLEQSPGFVYTIRMWFKYGHEWSYACHDSNLSDMISGRK